MVATLGFKTIGLLNALDVSYSKVTVAVSPVFAVARPWNVTLDPSWATFVGAKAVTAGGAAYVTVTVTVADFTPFEIEKVIVFVPGESVTAIPTPVTAAEPFMVTVTPEANDGVMVRFDVVDATLKLR